MAYPHGFLDEIRARLSVSQLVGRRVRLQKKGREFVGLSPFKPERTPSFTVNDDKGFYHCFATGEHGDIFTFVMKTEGLSFPEAVERLAGEAGVPVPVQTRQEREQAQQKQSLYSVLDLATSWFEQMLRAPAGRAARDYLQGRGLTPEIWANFRLGYAPEKVDGLLDMAQDKGIEPDQLIAAGLLRKADDGRKAYAFFRDRILFPISDRQGRIIAHGGRFMGDAKAAGVGKYINTADTALFDKGRTLYNLAQARQASHDGHPLLVAEGYMDVIALAQFGFAGAVAPLGTAITEEQLLTLWQMTEEPLLCLDGDLAGQKAALRAAERALTLLKPGKSLRFIFLPEGDDPDSFLRSQGRDAFAALCADAQPLDRILWQHELGQRAIDTPERRADLEARLMQHCSQIADEGVRKYYQQQFRDRLWNYWRSLRQPAGGGAGAANRGGWAGNPRWQKGRAADLPGRGPHRLEPTGGDLRKLSARLSRRQQEVLLAALLNHPSLIAPYAEMVTALPLPDDLAGLWAALLDIDVALADTAHAPVGTDLVAALPQLLEAQGVASGLLAGLRAHGLYQLAWQARPESSIEDVCELLDNILMLDGQERLQQQARNLVQQPVGSTTTQSQAESDDHYLQQILQLQRDLQEREQYLYRSDSDSKNDG